MNEGDLSVSSSNMPLLQALGFTLQPKHPWEKVKVNFSLPFLRASWQRPQKAIVSRELFSPASLIYRVDRLY